ncbi:SulP family inorganic anion transporter, partial [Nocardia gipuzkoensis]
VALGRLHLLGDKQIRVESVRTGLPVPDWSMSWEPGVVGALIAPAVAVALLGCADGLTVARRAAQAEDAEADAGRELRRFGIANLAAGLCSGMPVSAHRARTATLRAAGGRTRLAGGVVAALTVAALLLFTRIFEGMPSAVVAAIAIAAMIELPETRDALRSQRMWRRAGGSGRVASVEYVAAGSTAVAVLVCGVVPGLFLAVVLSLLLALRHATRVRLFVDRAVGVAVSDPVTIRVAAPLFCANVDPICRRILALCGPGTRTVALDLTACPVVDAAAAEAIAELAAVLAWRGVTLRVASAGSEPSQ